MKWARLYDVQASTPGWRVLSVRAGMKGTGRIIIERKYHEATVTDYWGARDAVIAAARSEGYVVFGLEEDR